MSDEAAALIRRIAEETAEAIHEVYRPLLGAKDAEIIRLRRLRDTQERENELLRERLNELEPDGLFVEEAA